MLTACAPLGSGAGPGPSRSVLVMEGMGCSAPSSALVRVRLCSSTITVAGCVWPWGAAGATQLPRPS